MEYSKNNLMNGMVLRSGKVYNTNKNHEKLNKLKTKTNISSKLYLFFFLVISLYICIFLFVLLKITFLPPK